MSPAVDKVTSDPTLPAQADIVVIGSGIVGSAAAFFLAKKGLRVAVVEKGHVAGEQSSRNWGWVRTLGKPIVEVPLSQLSLRTWDTLNAELGEDVGFRRAGVLSLTRDPAELAAWEEWTEQAREFQVPGQLLSAEEAQARAPSGEKWIGGWYSPTDGRGEPQRAAPALARGAQRAGVTIHQNCAARGLETQGGRVSGVITEKGTIRTSSVLCSAGIWSSLFLRRHGIDFPQAGVFATACRTNQAPAVTEGNIGSDEFAMRRREDGSYTVAVRMRGRVDLTPQSLMYAKHFFPMFKKRRKNLSFGLGWSLRDGPGGFARWRMDEVTPFERTRVLDPAPNIALVEGAMTKLRRAIPELAELRIEQAWGGLIDWTPDGMPIISPVDELPGLFIASGFSGIGFGLGPGAGRIAADMIAGDTPAVDLAPYRLERITGGPAKPGGYL